MVRKAYPKIEIKASPVNIGFGNAHNAILRGRAFDYYLPLNPDIVLAEDFLEKALSAFGKTGERLGAVNGLILYLDGATRTDRIYSCGHVLYRDRRIENLHYGKVVSDAGADREQEIFGPNGACPVLKRSMIDDIALNGNLFEPSFFMYGEDFDLGWRMIAAGWSTHFIPACKAWHAVSGSKPFTSRKIRVEYIANRYLVLLRNDTLGSFILDLPIFLAVEIFFFVIHAIRRPAFVLDFIKAMNKVRRHANEMLQHRSTRMNNGKRHAVFSRGTASRLLTLVSRQVQRKKRFKSFG
jgi:GT2 family glycosyltransferase